MKVFIFDMLNQVSGNWHSGGGLVIVAEDLFAATRMVDAEEDVEITEEEWKKVEVYELVGDCEPKMWIMPDAGCC